MKLHLSSPNSDGNGKLPHVWFSRSISRPRHYVAPRRHAQARCLAPRNAPHVAVFTVEGERHTLGLSLAELVLVEAGWRVVWLGEGPPLAELNPLIPKLKPDLLIVSASTWSSQSVIARYQAELMRVTSRHRIPVVLGGAGLWAAARGAHRIITFGELHSFLVRMQWRARTK
jgi:methanogenic corrinoid protein MtbC1